MSEVAMSDNKKQGQSGNQCPVMPGIFNKPNMFGFPPKIITRMRYNQYVTLTATTVVGNTFNLTSIFDPDTTGAGHQPMYHDQFATIYNHYTVIGSKLVCDFVTISGTTPAVVGIAVGDNSTFSTNDNALAEQNKNVRDIIGGSSSQNKTTLSATFGYVEDEGVDPYTGTDDARTLFGADPQENYYARIYAEAYDATTSTPVFCAVTIEYTVLCSELQDLAVS